MYMIMIIRHCICPTLIIVTYSDFHQHIVSGWGKKKSATHNSVTKEHNKMQMKRDADSTHE